jgi:hypothetical protein
MRFINKTGSKRIYIICSKAFDMIYNNKDFKNKIMSHGNFNHRYTSDGVNGEYVLNRLQNETTSLEVFFYKSRNPWTSSNGYTLDDGKPQIFLNTRKLGRSDASILATIIHEAVHIADNNDTDAFYHHGDNTPKGATAPEVFADIAYRVESGFYSDIDSSVENETNKGVSCYRSWKAMWLKRCYEVKS